MVDGDVHARLSPDKVRRIMRRIRKKYAGEDAD